MATQTIDARRAQYRSMRGQVWRDLVHQWQAFAAYVASNPTYAGGDRFRGPVNEFMDELLTHLPVDKARELVSKLPPGWAAQGQILLAQQPSPITAYVLQSQPTMQWGTSPVAIGTAGDLAQWDAWIRQRLATINAYDLTAFAAPVCGPRTCKAAEVPHHESWLSFGRVLMLLGVIGIGYVIVHRMRR